MHDFEIGAATRAAIARVQPYTLTTEERMVALKESVEYVVKAGIPGAVVECGVWRGGSMMLVALTLLGLRETRELWLYDTFSGMPAAGPEDELWTGQPAEMPLGAWCAGLDEVKANMARTGYGMERVRFVPGLVEDTLPWWAPEEIAILRLDTDWYSSTQAELARLFPRLSRGGVLIVDDYGHWLGARRAADEFVAALGEPLLLHRIDYTGRIAIRQGPKV